MCRSTKKFFFFNSRSRSGIFIFKYLFLLGSAGGPPSIQWISTMGEGQFRPKEVVEENVGIISTLGWWMVEFQCSPFPGDLKGNWRGDWGWSGDVTLAGSSDKLAHQYWPFFQPKLCYRPRGEWWRGDALVERCVVKRILCVSDRNVSTQPPPPPPPPPSLSLSAIRKQLADDTSTAFLS